ncbi:hypothetical protein NKJ91_16990 [Mesorhizobium sp. M0040]
MSAIDSFPTKPQTGLEHLYRVTIQSAPTWLVPAIFGGTASDPSASRHAARKQGLQMKSDHANPAHLRDFTTDARVLLIAGIAVVVATAGLFAGIALLKLIRLATNIAYFGQFTLADLKLQDTPRYLFRSSGH